MNRIVSFVRLDFYTLKPYKKTLLLFLALSIAMAVGLGSLATLSFYPIICLAMVIVYPFSIGETNRMDTLYAALPLRRREVVTSRYVFAVCMEVLTVVLAFTLSIILPFFTDLEFVLPEVLLYICIASFLFTLIVSLQYPLFFKMGYNKAKFLAYVPFMIIFLGFMFMPNLLRSVGLIDVDFNEFLELLGTHQLLVYGLPVIVGHLLLVLSCMVSHKLYVKRDV